MKVVRTHCGRLLLAVLMLVAGTCFASTLPFTEGFEAPYTNGATIASQHGWTSSGTAVVTNTAPHGGSSLHAYIGSEGSITNTFSNGATTNRWWTDLYVKAVGWDQATPPSVSSGVSAIFYVTTNQNPVVYDGTNSIGWVTNASTTWTTGSYTRVTVFNNYTDHKWALFLDGTLVTQQIGFADNTVPALTQLSVIGNGGTSLDDILVTNMYPSDLLSTDGDVDGMPDVWEIHYMGKTNYAAAADNDLDLVSNLDEYRYGSTDPLNDAQYPPTLTVASVRGVGYSYTVLTNSGSFLSQSVITSPVAGVVGTRYACTNGVVANNDYAQISATNVTLTLTNNATLTWLWQTEYELTTDTSGSGSVTVGGWHADGTETNITATPAAQYYFDSWSGDTNGCAVVGNVITAVMTEPRAITANFLPVPTGSMYLFK